MDMYFSLFQLIIILFRITLYFITSYPDYACVSVTAVTSVKWKMSWAGFQLKLVWLLIAL